jgi:hypothetical protein
MAQNLFNKSMGKIYNAAYSPCVFISHSKKDKDFAKYVADALLAMSVDIYFDEYDQVLNHNQNIDADVVIVKCIEDGLDNATHLLGLITPNTKNSWWVPYEIGGATGRKKECAHLVKGDVVDLPAFIRNNRIFPDQYDLAKWIESLTKQSSTILKETLAKQPQFAKFNSVFPAIRQISNLKFY